MFYSQIILAKKGPLGKIWLAAHWSEKLTKTQIFSTSIKTSVGSIVSPVVPLALRVSGHLLLGVVRIYNRKVKYLFTDCNDALSKMKLAFRVEGELDLPEKAFEASAAAVNIANFGNFGPDDAPFEDNMIEQWALLALRASDRNTIARAGDMDIQDVSRSVGEGEDADRFDDFDGDRAAPGTLKRGREDMLSSDPSSYKAINIAAASRDRGKWLAFDEDDNELPEMLRNARESEGGMPLERDSAIVDDPEALRRKSIGGVRDSGVGRVADASFAGEDDFPEIEDDHDISLAPSDAHESVHAFEEEDVENREDADTARGESEGASSWGGISVHKSTKRVLEKLEPTLQNGESVLDFQSTLRGATRKEAATNFFQLLVLATKHDLVTLGQEKPYGAIEGQGSALKDFVVKSIPDKSAGKKMGRELMFRVLRTSVSVALILLAFGVLTVSGPAAPFLGLIGVLLVLSARVAKEKIEAAEMDSFVKEAETFANAIVAGDNETPGSIEEKLATQKIAMEDCLTKAKSKYSIDESKWGNILKLWDRTLLAADFFLVGNVAMVMTKLAEVVITASVAAKGAIDAIDISLKGKAMARSLKTELGVLYMLAFDGKAERGTATAKSQNEGWYQKLLKLVNANEFDGIRERVLSRSEVEKYLPQTDNPNDLPQTDNPITTEIPDLQDGKLISSAGSRATNAEGKLVGNEAIAAILSNMWNNFERCPDPTKTSKDERRSALSTKVSESDDSNSATSMLLEMDTGTVIVSSVGAGFLVFCHMFRASIFPLIEAKAQHGALSEALRGVFSELALYE
eukprot:g4415.t1